MFLSSYDDNIVFVDINKQTINPSLQTYKIITNCTKASLKILLKITY